MILLDTNVVSEIMKLNPSPRVMYWLNSQDMESLWLPIITVMELRFGVSLLEPGSRRRKLESSIDQTVDRVFRGRIRYLDDTATQVFADRASDAQRNGRQVGFADTAIAAIAIAAGYRVATRDTAPFCEMGAEVINPWKVETGELSSDI